MPKKTTLRETRKSVWIRGDLHQKLKDRATRDGRKIEAVADDAVKAWFEPAAL